MKNNITKHPRYKKLLKEFHPTKNGELKLNDFSYGTHKKVWWKCNVVNDHEWEAEIKNRFKGTECGCCSGQITVLSNCLTTTHPNLSKQWHPTKNGDLTPYNVTAGSNKKIWWFCTDTNATDHEWEAVINTRVKQNQNCACCSGHKAVLSNCLATTHPEIAKKWHPTKNGELTPFNVTVGSNIKVWWKCYNTIHDDHEWDGRIADKINELRCPCCAGRKVVLSNCLITTHPEIAKEWHPTKNGNLTLYNVTFGSHKEAFWLCDKNKNHNCKSAIFSRVKGHGCKFCNDSKGEITIDKVLKKHSIIYKREKRYEKCKHKKPLPFDFYLPNHNILIEYDGVQHYKSIKWFGGLKKLKTLQLRDAIKTKFAEDNNILLLRIPYTEFNNIEKIIIEFINKAV